MPRVKLLALAPYMDQLKWVPPPATDAAEPTGSKAMNFKLEGIRGEVLPPLLLLDQLYKVQ